MPRVTGPPFGPDFLRAVAYAAEVHDGQRRRGVPYLAHLMGVAALVVEEGGDEPEAIAALLHDAAEDHGGEERLADIARRFGARVAGLVRALSDSLEPDGGPKAPWRERKERYLAGLGGERDASVLRVSNADKVENVRGLLRDYRVDGEAVWKRMRNRTREDQLWYYHELAGRFERLRPGTALARELTASVRVLERESSGAGPG